MQAKPQVGPKGSAKSGASNTGIGGGKNFDIGTAGQQNAHSYPKNGKGDTGE